jgi:hypothetical protein
MQTDPTPIEVTSRRAIRRAFRDMPPYSAAVFQAPADALMAALKGDPLLAALEPVEGGTLVRKHDDGRL